MFHKQNKLKVIYIFNYVTFSFRESQNSQILLPFPRSAKLLFLEKAIIMLGLQIMPKIIEGHPTEYFGKISVRMEVCLKISKIFSQRRYRLFKFFRKTIKFP